MEATAGQSAITEPCNSLLPELQLGVPPMWNILPVMHWFDQQVCGAESARAEQISPSSEAILAAQLVQELLLLQRGRNVLRNLATSTAANRQLDQFFIYINYLIIWLLSRQFSLIFNL